MGESQAKKVSLGCGNSLNRTAVVVYLVSFYADAAVYALCLIDKGFVILHADCPNRTGRNAKLATYTFIRIYFIDVNLGFFCFRTRCFSRLRLLRFALYNWIWDGIVCRYRDFNRFSRAAVQADAIHASAATDAFAGIDYCLAINHPDGVNRTNLDVIMLHTQSTPNDQSSDKQQKKQEKSFEDIIHQHSFSQFKDPFLGHLLAQTRQWMHSQFCTYSSAAMFMFMGQ